MSQGKKKVDCKPLKSLQLKDDFLFGELMLAPEVSREVLEIVLGKPVGKIMISNKEETISGGYTHKGIRLDAFMKDEYETHYDVEMQIREQKYLSKRIRHYQALCDMRILPAGESDYSKLPESHITFYRKVRPLRSEVWLCQTSKVAVSHATIFICTFDKFGRGRYCYTFENRCVEEPDLPLGDGMQKIILNTKGTNEDETSPELVEFLKLAEDMDAIEPTFARVRHVKKRAQKIKEREGMEEKYMLAMIRENEMKFEARQEGIKSIIQNMIRKNMSPEFISGVTDQPVEYIRRIQEEMLVVKEKGKYEA